MQLRLAAFAAAMKAAFGISINQRTVRRPPRARKNSRGKNRGINWFSNSQRLVVYRRQRRARNRISRRSRMRNAA